MNSLKNNLIAALVITIVLVGCQLPQASLPTATPIPSDVPDSCFGTNPDEDNIVNQNYCLREPYTTDVQSSIVQDVPHGWAMENIILNADGVKDRYSSKARIVCTANACTYTLHDGRTGIDGCWGYSQENNLPSGNYMIKVAGHSWINDPITGNAQNYNIKFRVDNQQVGMSRLPTLGEFEEVVGFTVNSPTQTKITVLFCAGYATPGQNSFLDVTGIGIISLP